MSTHLKVGAHTSRTTFKNSACASVKARKLGAVHCLQCPFPFCKLYDKKIPLIRDVVTNIKD
jgi:hypothetical protein